MYCRSSGKKKVKNENHFSALTTKHTCTVKTQGKREAEGERQLKKEKLAAKLEGQALALQMKAEQLQRWMPIVPWGLPVCRVCVCRAVQGGRKTV